MGRSPSGAVAVAAVAVTLVVALWVLRAPRHTAAVDPQPFVLEPCSIDRDELVRAVTYKTIPKHEREAVHRRIADALERLPSTQARRTATSLAYHRERAGQPAEAAKWYARAAEVTAALALDRGPMTGQQGSELPLPAHQAPDLTGSSGQGRGAPTRDAARDPLDHLRPRGPLGRVDPEQLHAEPRQILGKVGNQQLRRGRLDDPIGARIGRIGWLLCSLAKRKISARAG